MLIILLFWVRLDCGFTAHRKCSEKIPANCCPDLKYLRGVFGVDLTTLNKAHGTRLPFIVDMCIKEIEKRGLNSEGIYRVSGLRDEVEALRIAFDRGSKILTRGQLIIQIPSTSFQENFAMRFLSETLKDDIFSLHQNMIFS